MPVEVNLTVLLLVPLGVEDCRQKCVSSIRKQESYKFGVAGTYASP